MNRLDGVNSAGHDLLVVTPEAISAQEAAAQRRAELRAMGMRIEEPAVSLRENDPASDANGKRADTQNAAPLTAAAQRRAELRAMGLRIEDPFAPARKLSSEARGENVASLRRVAYGIGGAAIGAAIVAGSLLGLVRVLEDKPTQASADTEESAPLTTAEAEVQAPDVTTPTTEAPAPVIFEAAPGEYIGTLHIPAICEEIEVYAYSEQEKIDGLIGTGQALIDRLERDETPTEDCEIADQREAEREAQQGEVMSRDERHRASAMTIDNPDGKVDYWQPIAGHEQRADGNYTSVFPGQIGNSVIAGHGSTYNAAFADVPFLVEGDQAIFTRSDGKVFTYNMVEAQVLPANNDTPIRLYTHPGSPATMTLYLCSDAEGRTGSDASRYTVRWALDDSE